MKVSMAAHKLKAMHENAHPHSHFFDYDTLKFFGESMSTMNVLQHTAEVKDGSGVVHTCYVLSSLQRKDPRGPRRHRSYFDVETLEYIA